MYVDFDAVKRIQKQAESMPQPLSVEAVEMVLQLACEARVSPWRIFGNCTKKEYWGGSYQYSGMEHVVYSRLSLQHIPWEEWQEIFGLRIELGPVAKADEARDMITRGLEEDREELQTDEKELLDELSMVMDQTEDVAKLCELSFRYAEESSWDLWSCSWLGRVFLPSMTLREVPMLHGRGGLISSYENRGEPGSSSYPVEYWLLALLEVGLLTEEVMLSWNYDT